MDQYQQPFSTPEQPRRRRRSAPTAEAMPPQGATEGFAPATPTADEMPRQATGSFAPRQGEAEGFTPAAPMAEEMPRQATGSFAPPQGEEEAQTQQAWQARPNFAPEQRTIRSAPVPLYRCAAPENPAPPQAIPPQAAQPSFFDGKLHQQIGHALLGFLVTLLTLGICYPWALCRMQGWYTRHTVIEGRRLTFDGKATQLVGRWLLWMLLTLVTLGIYAFWVRIALEKWRVKHTHFAE